MNEPLCHSFQELATKTWHRLEQAEQTGMRWSEETNTETLLMTLHERHKDRIKVKAFSKHAEARNGADWEWWIGQHGNWLGMRVQAKRIEVSRAKFTGLQRQQTKGHPKTQIETLIDAARIDRLNPVYCFYTFCHPWPVGIIRPFSGIDGCLVAHASAVRTIGSETLFDLEPVAIPWHRLVCTPASGGNNLRQVNPALEVLLHSVVAAYGDGAQHDSQILDGDVAIYGPRASLPRYMERLAGPGLERLAYFDDEGALAEHAAERRLAGVVVIHTDSG